MIYNDIHISAGNASNVYVLTTKGRSNPKEFHAYHVSLFSKPTKFRPYKGKGLEANPCERVGDIEGYTYTSIFL